MGWANVLSAILGAGANMAGSYANSKGGGIQAAQAPQTAASASPVMPPQQPIDWLPNPYGDELLQEQFRQFMSAWFDSQLEKAQPKGNPTAKQEAEMFKRNAGSDIDTQGEPDWASANAAVQKANDPIRGTGPMGGAYPDMGQVTGRPDYGRNPGFLQQLFLSILRNAGGGRF